MNAPIFNRSYEMEQSLESYSCHCSCTCVCNCICGSCMCPGMPEPVPNEWVALQSSISSGATAGTSSNNRHSWSSAPGAGGVHEFDR